MTNYLGTDNHHIPQRALNHISPIEALQAWRKKSPELFVKRVCKQTELDIYPFIFFIFCVSHTKLVSELFTFNTKSNVTYCFI